MSYTRRSESISPRTTSNKNVERAGWCVECKERKSRCTCETLDELDFEGDARKESGNPWENCT